MPNLKHLIATFGLVMAATILLTHFAVAADEPRKIAFAKGATSTTVAGKIKGYDGIDYLIETSAGQLMHLLLSPSNRSCYFNVFEPAATAAAHNGSSAGNEFAVERTRPGSYRIQVYLMRNAARRNETCRYRLAVEITGPRGGVSAGTSDAIKQDVCRAEAAAMYGVEPRQVAVGAVRAAAGGDQIDGTADKNTEGVKKLRCLFKPDGAFDHIMAMTPDGE
jgi:hypothetical protein